MKFHPAKCEYILFSRKKVKSQLPSYMLHQELIPQVKAIRYLGVHIQDNLKWHTQIDMITTKSSTTFGFVKRTIPPQSSQLRIRAYKQLVRLVLEYAFCSWDLLPKTLSTRVKVVQRRSAWVVFKIPRVSRESTTELLGKLDWAPLKERRSHRRMCLFRAMHFAEVNAPLSDFVVSNKKTDTRRHNLQYRIDRYKTEGHMSTFFICTSKY